MGHMQPTDPHSTAQLTLPPHPSLYPGETLIFIIWKSKECFHAILCRHQSTCYQTYTVQHI